MKRIGKLLLRRLVFLVPQLFGVTLLTFMLVRLIPGNPAYVIAGPTATPEQIDAITDRLGLDEPIYVQYWLYLKNLAKGDLGDSWMTGTSVRSDLTQRVMATMELITVALVIVVVLGILVGLLVSLRPRGIADRISFGYGLLAGAFPDYWLGLSLIFVFFYTLGWFPAPVGQIDASVVTPEAHTGLMVVDALIDGNSAAFTSSLQHLVLPVVTLVLVYTGAVLKMTRSMMQENLTADYVTFARANGVGDRMITRYALRNSLPPVVTVVGLTYSFLLGSAVLVETVFSWGGAGQYAVEAVLQSDYNAIQGFILVAAVFNLIVFLAVDLLYLAIDPRRS